MKVPNTNTFFVQYGKKPSILYFNINLKYVDHMTTLCNLELLFNKQM
jgi:hypothetical protein